MYHHIKGQSRTQATLFAEALDNFLIDENPVRVIDAFVDSVDLVSLGFEKVKTKATGRPCLPSMHDAKTLYLWLFESYSIIPTIRKRNSPQC